MVGDVVGVRARTAVLHYRCRRRNASFCSQTDAFETWNNFYENPMVVVFCSADSSRPANALIGSPLNTKISRKMRETDFEFDFHKTKPMTILDLYDFDDTLIKRAMITHSREKFRVLHKHGSMVPLHP